MPGNSRRRGRYPGLSAVLQRGLELLREELEAREAETAALRTLLEERRRGSFIGIDEGRRRTEAMLARKRRELGIPG